MVEAFGKACEFVATVRSVLRSASGHRLENACQQLVDNGFTNVTYKQMPVVKLADCSHSKFVAAIDIPTKACEVWDLPR